MPDVLSRCRPFADLERKGLRNSVNLFLPILTEPQNNSYRKEKEQETKGIGTSQSFKVKLSQQMLLIEGRIRAL